MCQDEGEEFNSSANGLEEGGETTAFQFVNDTKYRKSTGDKNIFQEDSKIMGWQDRQIQPRNYKAAEQQNTKDIQGLVVKNLGKKWYQKGMEEDAENDVTTRLLALWVWKLQINFFILVF